MGWMGASLVRKILLSNFIRLPEPYKLTFSVTYRCNSRCKTCRIWERGAEDELTCEEIDRIFRNLNTEWVNLTDSEVNKTKRKPVCFQSYHKRVTV